MNNTIVKVEHEYDAPASLVWRAITENELMKHWYFDVPDFKPIVGCKFQFTGSKDDKTYIHLCEVIEVVSQKKLKYTWKYQGYDGLSFVTFELFPIGEKTKLVLTHEGLDSLHELNPDFAPENFIGGWKYLLKTALTEYLDKAFNNNK